MEIRQKLYEARSKRAQLVADADELLKAEKLEDWEAKTAEITEADKLVKALEKQVELAESFGGVTETEGQTEKAMAQPGVVAQEPTQAEKAVKAFAAAARKGFAVDKTLAGKMNEGVDAEGGYTVPQDIVTKINKYKESKESLLNEVTVRKVTTNKGRRTFQTRAKHTGFATVAEAAKIPELAKPKFETLEYNIEKRAGFLPVTNELLADSDNNIVRVAVEWLGDESLATGNREVLEVIKTNEETDLKDLDGIKKAWVKLGSAIRATSKIVTNDDGLTWLGTLKDKNGRELLTPNPAHPEQLRLAVGPYTIPVKTYDNDVLPSAATDKVPMIVGDLKQGVCYWDRQQLSIKVLTEATVGGVNLAEQDMTAWKGSIRDDCTHWDKAAFVNGYITVTGVAPAHA